VTGSKHARQRRENETNSIPTSAKQLSHPPKETDVFKPPPFSHHLTVRGNLSQKSLAGIVKRDDVVMDSEYLETIFIAVPRFTPSENNYIHT